MNNKYNSKVKKAITIQLSVSVFFLLIFISCKKAKETPYPYEDCLGTQSNKIEILPPRYELPSTKDTMFIVEVNGVDVTKVDTIRLETFCDVRFRVRVYSNTKISQYSIVSDRKGAWINNTNLVQTNMEFNFTAVNLNHFAYTQEKIELGFSMYNGVTSLYAGKHFIRNVKFN